MSQNVSIDILIGLDHYWDFFKPGIIKLLGVPVAQETIFVWVGPGPWQSLQKFEQSVCQLSHTMLCSTDVLNSNLTDVFITKRVI